MNTPTASALERLREAISRILPLDWEDAKEPNGKGMGWQAGPGAWLGRDSYSKETANAAAFIAAANPEAIRTLLSAIDAKDAEIEALRGALQDVLSAHANDTVRPKAFYIASAALNAKETP